MNNENINYDLSSEKIEHTYFPCEKDDALAILFSVKKWLIRFLYSKILSTFIKC